MTYGIELCTPKSQENEIKEVSSSEAEMEEVVIMVESLSEI